MIARQAKADVNVIALLGERGREVRDFIENSLGAEGLARSVDHRRHRRPGGARSRARRARRHLNRRVLPRSGQGSAADGRLGHARRDGVARDRARRRRAADHEGLSAVGVRRAAPACSSARAPSDQRQHHRHLHGARGRRRLQRTDRRREPLDPRRSHRADAQARQRRPLPVDRHAREQEPRTRSRHHERPARRGQLHRAARSVVP